MKKVKNIALVCCRLGSKGLKQKNLKLFCGKPILFWLNKNLKKARIFDEIVLSTDSTRIKKIGIEYGMIIPGLRPKRLSKDNSDVFETHKYIFKKLSLTDYNSNICIVNNSPFLRSDYFSETFKLFKKYNYTKVVLLAKKVDKDQIYFKQSTQKKNFLFPKFKKGLIQSKVNRHELPNYFYNLGDLRWGKTKMLSSFKNFNKQISKGFLFKEISDYAHIDINNITDWKFAQKVFKMNL